MVAGSLRLPPLLCPALVEPARSCCYCWGHLAVATYAAVCYHPPLHLEAYLVQCAHITKRSSACRCCCLAVLSVPAQILRPCWTAGPAVSSFFARLSFKLCAATLYFIFAAVSACFTAVRLQLLLLQRQLVAHYASFSFSVSFNCSLPRRPFPSSSRHVSALLPRRCSAPRSFRRSLCLQVHKLPLQLVVVLGQLFVARLQSIHHFRRRRQRRRRHLLWWLYTRPSCFLPQASAPAPRSDSSSSAAPPGIGSCSERRRPVRPEAR